MNLHNFVATGCSSQRPIGAFSALKPTLLMVGGNLCLLKEFLEPLPVSHLVSHQKVSDINIFQYY